MGNTIIDDEIIDSDSNEYREDRSNNCENDDI